MRKNNGRLLKLSISLLTFIILTVILFLFKMSGNASASDTPAYLTFHNFDPRKETGSEQNPFIILEIVPYRGMGQIGYIIGGQEPVDPGLSSTGNEIYSKIDSFAYGAFIKQADGSVKNTEIFKKQVLHIADKDTPNYHIRVVTITPDVLNKNVEQFTKYYDLRKNGKNNKKSEGENANGEIDLIGNADLISINTMAQAGNTVVDLWESYGRDKSGISKAADRYERGFKKNDLSWQTAMELFMKVGVVDDTAAFLYDINCLTYHPESSYMKIGISSFVTSANGNGYRDNIYKLCLMLRVRDPLELYNLYLNTENGTQTPAITETTVNTATTGCYNPLPTENAKVYWNDYTFLPAYPGKTYPSDITEDYKLYLRDSRYLIDWISGECHDSVIRNTYSYNGASSIVQNFANRASWVDLKETVVSYVSAPYQYNTELFDYLETKAKASDTAAVRPMEATPCEAVEYILHKDKKPSKEITILDLEPCNDFTLTVREIRQKLPALKGNIIIKQQTTAEFIGKKEDLNDTFDLIYIGTNIGKMNQSGGKTIYNDPLLDGLVYLHTGDRIVGYDNLKGIIKNESSKVGKALDYINFSNETYNKNTILKGYSDSSFAAIKNAADFYRYSGNDITNRKKQELEEYISAKFPILLENNLYTRNKNMIDDSSYLYEFLQDNSTNGTFDRQIFNIADFTDRDKYLITQKKITDLLKREKLTVDLIKTPSAYNANDSSTLILDRTLDFTFRINPPSNSSAADQYRWKIYVDNNADGRFSDTEIILSDISHAEEVSRSKCLSSDYMGVIPWKLEVESSTNPNIRTMKTGFAAFKVPDMGVTEKKKTQIDILQITSNDSNLNLQNLMNPVSGKTSLFYKYTKDLDNFNVNITTINVDDFLKKYQGAGNQYDKNKSEETDKLYYMNAGRKKSYDMLIFGFGDCYSDISNENGALNNVQAFINSGKSVMFTHDTTSFVNLTKEEYNKLGTGLSYWGYGFNRYVRNIAGLDRFGVLKQASDSTPYDKAVMPGQAKKVNIYRSSSITNGGTTYPEVQALTYGCLVSFNNPTSNSVNSSIYNANRNYPPFSTGNTISNKTALGNYETNFVTKVNEGQITNYPYDIPDGFEISKTHVQYYQINMDDPEIVVWYCLSDAKSNEYPSNKTYKENNDHTNETGPYSTSPNDVRNNYYIYSKGNIMYTGVGHSSLDAVVDETSTGTSYKENEVKLFINTMIASYSAGIEPPSIEITNREAVTDSSGDYTIYEYSEKPADLDKEVRRIRFAADDSNLLSEDLVIRAYTYNSAGSPVLLSPDQYTVFDSDFGNKAVISESGGIRQGYLVKIQKEYYFDYPLSVFGSKGTDKLYLTVTNKENLTGDTSVTLLSRSLFDLD